MEYNENIDKKGGISKLSKKERFANISNKINSIQVY